MNTNGKWVIQSDGDGHWYIIPLEHVDKFEGWVAMMEGDNDDYEGPEFGDYRINMYLSNFVFEGVWTEKKD